MIDAMPKILLCASASWRRSGFAYIHSNLVGFCNPRQSNLLWDRKLAARIYSIDFEFILPLLHVSRGRFLHCRFPDPHFERTVISSNGSVTRLLARAWPHAVDRTANFSDRCTS